MGSHHFTRVLTKRLILILHENGQLKLSLFIGEWNESNENGYKHIYLFLANIIIISGQSFGRLFCTQCKMWKTCIVNVWPERQPSVKPTKQEIMYVLFWWFLSGPAFCCRKSERDENNAPTENCKNNSYKIYIKYIRWQTKRLEPQNAPTVMVQVSGRIEWKKHKIIHTKNECKDMCSDIVEQVVNIYWNAVRTPNNNFSKVVPHSLSVFPFICRHLKWRFASQNTTKWEKWRKKRAAAYKIN